MKTCVVVPTYNERENVASVVEGVRSSGAANMELLFVDDNSPDGTAEAVRQILPREPWVHLMVRESKKGIGSAYKDGFKYALDTFNPAALVEMDADLQHPPDSLKGLLSAIEEGADVAIASRYTQGGGIEGWGESRRLVSWGANALARLLLGLSVKDCTSGFRAFSSAAAVRIVDADLPANGFEFQVATLHLLRTGTKTVEVPYVFSQRRAGKSKLGAFDVARFFFNVLRMAL